MTGRRNGGAAGPTRLIREGQDRRNGEASLVNALAWLEGLPPGEQPRTVDRVMAARLGDWAACMDEPMRNEILLPALPGLLGAVRDVFPGMGDRFRHTALGGWVPAWLRLAGFETRAAEIESLDPMGDEVTDRMLDFLQENQTVSQDPRLWAEAQHAVLASGQWFASFEPWEPYRYGKDTVRECAYRTARGNRAREADELTLKHARGMLALVMDEIQAQTGA